MKCDNCGAVIEKGEERDYYGQTLCEDCYMDFVSPAKACDPWAVYSAKTLMDQNDQSGQVNPTQEKILAVLRETGGLEPEELARRLDLKPADLEREIAALRHMEMVRGELRDGKKVICTW